MTKGKIEYMNFLGDFNVLITVSSNRYPAIFDYYIFESQLWIHDNVVKKNHMSDEPSFELGSIVSNNYIDENFIKKKYEWNYINGL